MKAIGVIGGMTWQSTAMYYRQLNEKVNKELEGARSSRCILSSLDFSEVKQLQMGNDWLAAENMLLNEAQKLKNWGADILLVSSATMHKATDSIEQSIDINFVHLADVTAEAIVKNRIKRVALFGTKFTMLESFFKERLMHKSGAEIFVPNAAEMEVIHDVIYEELSKGILLSSSRKNYLSIIERMSGLGCEAVILGCTEIGMLVRQEHTRTMLIDTTSLHTSKAIELAIA